MTSSQRTGAPGSARQRNVAAEALASCRGAFLAVALFSAAVNILMLTGSIYMLQVYDRVLPSHSVETLVALSLIVFALYVVMGIFDWLRQRILVRIGVALDQRLSPLVVSAILKRTVRAPEGREGAQLSKDLDSVRGFLSGMGPTAFFDLPWMPLYVFACFLLHPYLGILLVGGALFLVFVALLTEIRTRGPTRDAAQSSHRRTTLLDSARRNAEIVAALGMEGEIVRRFGERNDEQLAAQQRTSDTTGGFGTVSRVARFILQSAILGAGAWLVMRNEASPGVMIAASVLSSRALAPVELAIGNWRPFLSARQAWQRLRSNLRPLDEAPAVAPDRPRHSLLLDQVFVAAPGGTTPIIKGASFALKAGQAVGVIGPSASGKSSLARALVGVWPVARGELRLDGATLDQWADQARGRMIGYLPQDIELFDGTVAENIARFDPQAKEQAVLAAAKAAGAYDMILRLPKGFETVVGEAGGSLSGGQRQRVGLARALYGDPFLVVLDEPNSNLDADGEAALTQAIHGIRARGGIAVVIAHRPSALAGVDLVLTLAEGQVAAFGPRDEVLRKTLAPQSPGQPQRTRPVAASLAVAAEATG